MSRFQKVSIITTYTHGVSFYKSSYYLSLSLFGLLLTKFPVVETEGWHYAYTRIRDDSKL